MNPLLDPNAKLVVAHRGNRAHAPENTIESFRQARELGADALELDVRMSRDGHAVVIHDATVDRTTNGKGPVAAHTLSELRALDAAAKFGGRYPVTAMPRLEEVFDAFRDIPIVIEVKELPAVEATEAVVRRFGAQGRVIVGSAREAVMQHFYGTGLSCCASGSDATRLMLRGLTGLTPRNPKYQVVSVPPRYYGFPIPIVAMAAAARRAGIPTQVWTVNDPARAAWYWRKGVAAIVTDDPAAMIRARSR
ncbi:MAG TPA: glycerophosphodiester phosphodiesterase family protein [Gemmatimonadaceae bacterium]|nr:glycerophosphodiester phosphodiesterase family protein [Gemmatimonadaceae bacterium]